MRQMAVLLVYQLAYSEINDERKVAMAINDISPSEKKHLIQRLHRIQGQLKALERSVAEGNTCEKLVTQAYTVEKALSSFIMQVLDDYFDCHINILLDENPEEAKVEIRQLFKLVNRWTITIRKNE